MPYSFIIKTTGSGPRFSCYSSCYSLDYEPFYISNKRVQQKFSDQFHIKTSLLHLHKNWHKLPLCILLVLRLDLKNMLSFTSTSFFYFFRHLCNLTSKMKRITLDLPWSGLVPWKMSTRKYYLLLKILRLSHLITSKISPIL